MATCPLVCAAYIPQTYLLLSKSRIYDKDHSIDSKWCFCNICRDHHFPANSTIRPFWRCWFKDSLLQIWWQRGVQWNTLHLTNFWSQVVHFSLYSLASFINFLYIVHCMFYSNKTRSVAAGVAEMVPMTHFVSQIKKRQRWDVQTTDDVSFNLHHHGQTDGQKKQLLPLPYGRRHKNRKKQIGLYSNLLHTVWPWTLCTDST